MKTVQTHSKQALIDIRGLIFIYIILCILIIPFARFFFSKTLQDGEVPGILEIVIFLTIPEVLLLFLVVSSLSLLRDLIAQQVGSKFQTKLLAYFSLIVIFASVPVTIITAQSVTEFVRFWKTIDVVAAMNAAQQFALDTYSLHLEKFENMIKETNLDSLRFFHSKGATGGSQVHLPIIDAPGIPMLPEGITGIQDFALQDDGIWETRGFLGEAKQELPFPPSLQQGFVSREMPRDRDNIRYMLYPEKELLRVISYHLGTGFDAAIDIIKNETARFEIINSLGIKVKPLLIVYYGIFFFPTLLMSLIIAISFTQRVTQPIVELTEAIRQVAAGNFSIHIMDRRDDELGLLIRSFNTMVQDIEKSQASFVKAKKISIWQSLAAQLAHEIKNPLTPIKLSAELVIRRWRNDPARIGEIIESSMETIIQETEGLLTLLTEFRILSRPLELSLSWTNLRELTEKIIAPYINSYPSVQFNTAHLSPDISIKIDRQRLSQVLTNLIINSIDAMNGNGTIDIRTDLVKKRENQYCRLSIKDNGKGITKQEESQIFTPYFTTKEAGTGLGLSIVERIVYNHGGSIWFNSAEGMGTTFFIDLPVMS